MSPAPDAARQILIRALVASLWTAGVWPKMGVLYVFAAAAAQPALLNWRNPAGTPALAVNSPTFTADRGYAGDGVSAYIDTQIPWNAIPEVALDDAHLGAYLLGTVNWVAAVGLSGSAAVRLDTGSGLFRTSLNSGSDQVDAPPFSVGVHAVTTRAAAAGYERYLDGAAVTPVVRGSTALNSASLRGLNSSASFAASTVSLRALHAGSKLTAGEVAAMRTAIQTYMAAVGAS